MINIPKLPEPISLPPNVNFNQKVYRKSDIDKYLTDLFKDAVEVYGRKIENQWGSTEREIYWGDGGTSIHKALLIQIIPIKEEETADSLLEEMVHVFGNLDKGAPGEVVRRARQFLATLNREKK